MEETSVAGDPGPDAGTSTAPNAAPEPVARRQRILFVGEAATLAHVVRPFVLARSLDPSRYEVHFACDPRFNKLWARSRSHITRFTPSPARRFSLKSLRAASSTTRGRCANTSRLTGRS